jgi:CDP-diacylglycerol pyrophosphatase
MLTESCRSLLGLTLAAIMVGCAAAPISLPPPPVHANGQVLWHIVSEHCIPDQRDRGNPAPCAKVSVADGIQAGYVVLKDRVGKSQYLVMPTIMITGIEDPQLLTPGAPDYFTPAWSARKFVAKRLGTGLAREDVGIAINSLYGRTQDLLHLHVDCLRTDVRDALRLAAPTIGHHWVRHALILNGYHYRAVRVDGDDAVAANPFRLLSKGLHVRQSDMGAWTLVLAGMDYPDGPPGFVLLAARANPAAGYKGSGEDLQDHACTGRDALARY